MHLNTQRIARVGSHVEVHMHGPPHVLLPLLDCRSIVLRLLAQMSMAANSIVMLIRAAFIIISTSIGFVICILLVIIFSLPHCHVVDCVMGHCCWELVRSTPC